MVGVERCCWEKNRRPHFFLPMDKQVALWWPNTMCALLPNGLGTSVWLAQYQPFFRQENKSQQGRKKEFLNNLQFG